MAYYIVFFNTRGWWMTLCHLYIVWSTFLFYFCYSWFCHAENNLDSLTVFWRGCPKPPVRQMWAATFWRTENVKDEMWYSEFKNIFMSLISIHTYRKIWYFISSYKTMTICNSLPLLFLCQMLQFFSNRFLQGYLLWTGQSELLRGNEKKQKKSMSCM